MYPHLLTVRIALVCLFACVLLNWADSSAFAQTPQVTSTSTATPTPPATPALAPNPFGQGGNPIGDPILNILMTLIDGCLGGVVYELISLQGNIERPHPFAEDEVEPGAGGTMPALYAKAANMYDLGILARIFVGAMAAIVTLLAITPQSYLQVGQNRIVSHCVGLTVA